MTTCYDRHDTLPQLAVLRSGVLTTVQDLGRPGQAHLGVPHSGAADARSAALANRLVTNPPDAALLETTVTGCALRLSVARWVAVTGAPASVHVDDRPVAFGRAVFLPALARLEIGPAVAGVRSYVAVAGGVNTCPVLGSRSTDLLSGLGPAPLSAGVTLPLGRAPTDGPSVHESCGGFFDGTPVLRAVPGPHTARFPPAAFDLLRSTTWQVLPQSNRIGLRLDGTPLPSTATTPLPSEGMASGALQVPPNGLPVLFLADHPTTGGYPVIACIHPDDLDLAAQAAPGTRLTFRLLPDWLRTAGP